MGSAGTELNMDAVNKTKHQLFGYLAAHLVSANLLIGEKLGLIALLMDAESAKGITLAELADKAQIKNVRLLKEWALCLLSNGFLAYTPGDTEDDDLYYMPKEVGVFFARDGGPFSGAWPFVSSMTCLPPVMDVMITKYKDGTGINWGDLPEPIVQAVADFFQPVYTHLLPTWIRTLHPAVSSKFGQPITVIDVGCGTGHSSCEMAKNFPNIRVIGVDYHAPSISKAKHLLHVSGQTNVEFVVGDSSSKTWHGTGEADVTTFFDCWHDMEDPAEACRQAYTALKPDGIAVVIDPHGAELPGVQNKLDSPLTPVFAGCSSFLCTPTSLGSEGTGAGFGACIPTEFHKKLFMDAGFKSVEVMVGDNGPMSPTANGFRFIVARK
eukprot:CAMPEP_0184694634 /NCGR_PEP_ID=MMETSP0313-20130426/2516_1 /TAXON_ID=2792 /ORGANISM="Porphyridium aerugineum, Strain SAG 1380-2" /LENGTH=380 /DNA_ID=CAMNT_0027152947 /DNA_START=358 /DNA_END=1500 /DNA_ORIENTATION=-